MRKMIFGAVLAFFLVQCATVNQGPMQRIRVGSKPAGASVKLTECGAGSTDSAKTPAIVFVNRRATRCAVTFTLPEYGSRTVSLFRTGRALDLSGPPEGFGNVLNSLPTGSDPISGTIGAFGVAGVVVGGTIWGMSRGIDSLTGANYRQNRSTVVVDFNKLVPDVVGRYALVSVNGMELPAKTWTTRNGKCEIWTNSGSIVLEQNGRWRSVITEQQLCGKKKRAPAESTTEGVFTVDGNQILLESEAGAALAVFEGDLLEVTMRGARGETAVYRLQLSQ
jgi:hypothetical protein